MNDQLIAKNISKSFPGTLALDDVTLSFEAGVVHAILGKNGSGKSTLMKIFSGVHEPSSGAIYLNGSVIKHNSPEKALQNGIATVYQELSVVRDLTVAENLFIGKMPMKNRIQIDWKKVNQLAKEVMTRLKIDIDVELPVRELPIGQQQLVEIAKAMLVHPKVLILDEATSALTDTECESLFSVVKELKEQNLIILFITHKLQEVFKIADQVSVLRDGKLIGTEQIKNLDPRNLIHMMFGNVEHSVKPDSHIGEEILMQVQDLCNQSLHHINFSLHSGEILGLAGMLGSGRTELLRAIYGLDKIDSGRILIRGTEVKKATPYIMKNCGCGFTSENRKEEGLCLRLDVGENLVLANLKAISPHGRINKKIRRQYIDNQIQELDIVTQSAEVPAGSLSGGNQQKVVVGNWINSNPQILFLDEPSRGIDVNAKQQIFRVIWREAAKGVGIIMVSSELEELLEVCDRVLIMREGWIVDEKKTNELNVETIYTLCMQEGAVDDKSKEENICI